jgi:hypothetical protein
MSKLGEITRGYKWTLQKNNKSELPKGILEDEFKMNDVRAYEEFIKGKNEKEVNQLIIALRILGRDGKRKEKKYKEFFDKLFEEKEVKKKKGSDE